ncbi:hypothetical protein CNMCM6936_001615 [Aspergillus lentulus]|nr:hypothetical protein CNMCM6936_001615 [Aspergillus lentulus]
MPILINPTTIDFTPPPRSSGTTAQSSNSYSSRNPFFSNTRILALLSAYADALITRAFIRGTAHSSITALITASNVADVDVTVTVVGDLPDAGEWQAVDEAVGLRCVQEGGGLFVRGLQPCGGVFGEVWDRGGFEVGVDLGVVEEGEEGGGGVGVWWARRGDDDG